MTLHKAKQLFRNAKKNVLENNDIFCEFDLYDLIDNYLINTIGEKKSNKVHDIIENII